MDAIRLVRGIYKLGIATNDAIEHLEKGNRSAALAALLDAQPLTIELYNAFSNQKKTDKWRYWFRSATNKDFYLLYNLYQKARLHLETETMDVVTGIEPQRRPFRGNAVMHDPAKEGDAVYGAQGERHENTVWNGSLYSIINIPLEGAFQINGIRVEGRWQWSKIIPDYGLNYSFTLSGKSKVYVACQKGSVPGWIAEDGFISTGKVLEVGHWGWPYRYQNRPPDQVHKFEIFSKDFPAGEVVLGRNSEDKEELPYIVFVKPSALVFENFRDTEFDKQPKAWKISGNGGVVSVIDIPDYDGELRPSIFDLTTVPRYTPLDLRGLKLETTSRSIGASTAEYLFTEPAEGDFIMDIRLKAGQEDQNTGFALITVSGYEALKVTMNDKAEVEVCSGDGDGQVVSQYSAGRWYNIKLRVSLADGKAVVDVQDDKLNVSSSGKFNIDTGQAPVNRIKLIHSQEKEGVWIVYNAISAYLK